MRNLVVNFGPCDRLNPGFGYALTIQDAHTGQMLLRTGRHPATGEDLDLRMCLEVISYYVRDAARRVSQK